MHDPLWAEVRPQADSVTSREDVGPAEDQVADSESISPTPIEPGTQRSNPEVTIDDLPPGASATIRTVRLADDVIFRLMELGLVPGARVEVQQRAPFGDPIRLRLGHSRLSIRRREATCFTVDCDRDENRALSVEPVDGTTRNGASLGCECGPMTAAPASEEER